MFGHIVHSASLLPLLAAATTHRTHSPATWIFPVLLVLVFFMLTRRQRMRRQGQGPGRGPAGPPMGPQRRPRNARQAMNAPSTAWESDTEPRDAEDRSSDT